MINRDENYERQNETLVLSCSSLEDNKDIIIRLSAISWIQKLLMTKK